MFGSVFSRLSRRQMLFAMRFWPPFLGAGIRIQHVNEDLTEIVVSMKLQERNRNFVGTHYGGNLYSMCDPWYMFMLMWKLGDDYVVWDQAAEIEFTKPGTGTVTATFQIPLDTVEALRNEAESGDKLLPEFRTTINDESGDVVANIRKVVYVRKKRGR